VEIKEDYKVIGDDGTITNENNYLERTDLISILDNYFVWDHDNYAQFHTLLQALYCYLYQVQEMNMKPEDARMVLPNATKTNITMSINLRELIHVSNLRLCTRAQLEIRLLFQAIKKEVEQVDKRLGDLLVPSCVSNGCCKEIKPCYYYKKVLKDEK
jgi:thymidylate synthase (FAD)